MYCKHITGILACDICDNNTSHLHATGEFHFLNYTVYSFTQSLWHRQRGRYQLHFMMTKWSLWEVQGAAHGQKRGGRSRRQGKKQVF